MMTWYFKQTKEKVWLGTSPDTRAEIFYRKSGWNEIGVHGKGEIKFEMTFENWRTMKQNIKSIRPFIGSENFKTSREFYSDLGFEETVLKATCPYSNGTGRDFTFRMLT